MNLTDKRVVVVWQTDPDADFKTDTDRRYQYAVIENGTVSYNGSIDNVTLLEAGAGSGETLDFAYVPAGTETITIESLDLETHEFTTVGQYEAGNVTDIAVSDGDVAWLTESDITYHSEGEGVETLELREDLEGVRDIGLATADDRTVLTYRGKPATAEEWELIYRINVDGNWITDRSYAQGETAELRLFGADTVVTNNQFLSVYMAEEPIEEVEPGTSPKPDLFYTEHQFLPDYVVSTSVNETEVEPGDALPVEYTVANEGDIPSDDPVTVTLSDGQTVKETQTIDPVAPGEEVTDEFTAEVPSTGKFTVEVDPVDEIQELSTENNDESVTLVRPDLKISEVSHYQTGENVTINATLRNIGPVTAQTVAGAVTDHGEVVTESQVGTIEAADETAVELSVPADSVDPVTPTKVSFTSETGVNNTVNSTERIRPNKVDLETTIIDFEGGEQPTVNVLVTNSENGTANASLVAETDDGVVGEAVAEIPGVPDGTSSTFRTVEIPLSDISTGQYLTVTAKSDYELDPLTNSDSTTVPEIDAPPTITELTVQNPENRTLNLTIEADKQLDLNSLAATIEGPETTTLEGAEDFIEHSADGTNNVYIYGAEYTVEADGTYTATLESAESTDGIAAETDQSDTVTVETNEPPEAVLEVSTDQPVSGEPTTLDASESSDPDGTIESYAWDFNGDGNYTEETTTAVVEHTYTSSGTYTATVKVTDDAGATDTASVTVEVYDRPEIAGFELSNPVEQELEIEFNSTESLAADSLEVVVTGPVNETVTSFTEESISAGYTYTASVIPGEDGTYTATLESAESTEGIAAETGQSDTVTVETNEPPEAALEVSTDQPVSGEPTTLDASESSDPDGTIESYAWDFNGDGNYTEETTTAVVEHTYTSSGTYTATVKVTDDAGATDTASVTVEVASEPTAEFDYSPSDPDTSDTITFDASNSKSETEITSYHWDLNGDGEIDETTSTPTLEHSYDESGTYDVTLYVENEAGLTDSTTKTIEVDSSGGIIPGFTFMTTLLAIFSVGYFINRRE